MTETPERDEFEGLVEEAQSCAVAVRGSIGWNDEDAAKRRKTDAADDLMYAYDTLTAERDDLLQRREFMQSINAAYHGVCGTLTGLVKSYRQLWLGAKEAHRETLESR